MKRFLAIIMIISMLFVGMSLAACGDKDSNSTGSNSGNGSNKTESKNSDTTASPAEQSQTDKEMLEANGYTVFRYTSYLESYDAALKVESGSVKAFMYAYDNDGNGVTIYYFKNAQLAQTAYNNSDDAIKPAYKLRGNMLLLEDTTGLFD